MSIKYIVYQSPPILYLLDKLTVEDVEWLTVLPHYLRLLPTILVAILNGTSFNLVLISVFLYPCPEWDSPSPKLTQSYLVKY